MNNIKGGGDEPRCEGRESSTAVLSGRGGTGQLSTSNHTNKMENGALLFNS